MARKSVPAKKFKSWRNEIFTAPSGKRPVVVHFGRRVRYEVVMLDTKDFPKRDRKRHPITWLAGWAVVPQGRSSPKSRTSAAKAKYTVFVPRPRRKPKQWFYYDGRNVHSIPNPMYHGKKPPRSGMVQVRVNGGDPGVGYT